MDNINHEPPEYHVWNILRGLVNVENVNFESNITEIPSEAFISLNERQTRLTKIKIKTPNYLTIKKRAFDHLDHLKIVNFISKIDNIENEAFVSSKNC